MIRAIALDDEPPALRVLTHFCGQVEFVRLEKTFTRTDDAQQHLARHGADLLFLDINMPFMSGLEFAKAAGPRQAGPRQAGPRQAGPRQAKQNAGTPVATLPPMVIFTTAYAEHAVEGFTLNAVDYLLKPFTFERFRQAVTKAHEYFQWQRSAEPATDPFLYVRADYTVFKLALADVLYVEGLDDYLKIHLRAQPHPIVARLTMKALLEKLPAGRFLRIHRSFIVSLDYVTGLRNKALLVAGRELPIGASYEADVLGRFRT